MNVPPFNNVSTVDHKDTYFSRQRQLFFSYLRSRAATCTMAAKAIGIERPNCTRYKRELQKAGLLWEVGKGICPITHFPAMFLTTDPAKAESYHQPSNNAK